MGVIIYDTNNWVRMNLEKDYSGLGMRGLWYEVIRNDGNVRIFVADGMKCNEIRRKLLPEYKMTRKPARDSFYDNLKFFKELLKHAPKTVGFAEVPFREADDVIADIAKKFETVTVMSTDRDLMQIKNAQFPLVKRELTDRNYLREYKILVGDTSDNIKGVSGFGQSTFNNNPNAWVYLKQYCDNPYQIPVELEKLLPTRALTALRVANPKDIEIMRQVVEFMPVGEYDIKWGSGNAQEAEAEMAKFLL